MVSYTLPLDTITPSAVIQFMSVFQNARDNTIHFQDSSLTAVGGDQKNSGFVTMAGPQHIAGNQTNYLVAPLEGALLKLRLSCLITEIV